MGFGEEDAEAKCHFHHVTSRIYTINIIYQASLMAQRLKRLPGMWETRVQSLGQEVPLEKEMATHSSTLAWGIPWTEEPGGWATVHGVAESDVTE